MATGNDNKIKRLISIKQLTYASDQEIRNIIHDFLELHDWKISGESGLAIMQLSLTGKTTKWPELDAHDRPINPDDKHEYHNILEAEFYSALGKIDIIQIKEIITGCYIGVLIKNEPHLWDLYLLFTYGVRGNGNKSIEAVRNVNSLRKTFVLNEFNLENIVARFTRPLLFHYVPKRNIDATAINQSTMFMDYFCNMFNLNNITLGHAQKKMIIGHLDKDIVFVKLVAEGLTHTADIRNFY